MMGSGFINKTTILIYFFISGNSFKNVYAYKKLGLDMFHFVISKFFGPFNFFFASFTLKDPGVMFFHVLL